MSIPGEAPAAPGASGELVTITGDGTFRAPAPGSPVAQECGGDARLAALVRLRSLLGDPPEEQIGTRLQLPAALGEEPADQLLPASLALLAGTAGDLAGYGWRLGTGAGLAWHRARELRERTLDAARIALLGYTGPLTVTAFGPVTLAAATFLGSGERTLSDRGALRDLPHLLAEGLTAHREALAARVPGAQPIVLLREDGALAVLQGRVRVPSGYRTYPALPWPEIVPLWRTLIETLPDAALAVPAHPELLAAAREAGCRRVALPLAGLGPMTTAGMRALWERIATTREEGVQVELLVDPARFTQQTELLAASWRELGYAPTDLAGLTLLAHRSRSGGDAPDPALEPSPDSLLTSTDVETVLRAAPAWAERVGG